MKTSNGITKEGSGIANIVDLVDGVQTNELKIFHEQDPVTDPGNVGLVIQKSDSDLPWNIAQADFYKLIFKHNNKLVAQLDSDSGLYLGAGLDVSAEHGIFEHSLSGPDSMYLSNNIRLKTDPNDHELLISERNPAIIPSALAAYDLSDIQTMFPTISTLSEVSSNQYLQFGKSKLGQTKSINDIFLDSDFTNHPTIGQLQSDLTQNTSYISTNDSEIVEINQNLADIDNVSKIYVDGNRQDSYVEEGSRSKPFKNVTTAFAAKLEDANTVPMYFFCAPGVYEIGSIAITKTSANQSFTVVGSGTRKTRFMGSSTFDNTSGNLFFLRRFKHVSFMHCAFENVGGYAFYPRDCESVTLHNCLFQHCGSSGQENRHDLTGSQTEQAAYWAGDQTGDGATRIRDCEQVSIQFCEICYCSRGLRIQDCGQTGKLSKVTNNICHKNLEASIYLASGTYNGQGAGCENFLITSNTLLCGFNNAILSIGSKHVSITNNVCKQHASSSIMLWHCMDTVVQSNICQNDCILTYNGVGNDGDSFGSCVCDGNTVENTGKYQATIMANSFLECNPGRSANSIGIHIKNSVYPGAQKLIISGNISDAHTRISNSLPVQEVQAPVSISPPALVNNICNASFSSLNAITSHIFDVGDNVRGSFNISLNNSVSAGAWFDIRMKVPISHDNAEGRYMSDMLVIPAGRTYTIIEQTRSHVQHNNEVNYTRMDKRCYLEYTSASAGVFVTVFFRITE